MRRVLFGLSFVILPVLFHLNCSKAPTSAEQFKPNPMVEIETSMGNLEVELFADKAPLTVENFLGYVKRGFYAGTIFHRVVPGFVIQGGGYTVSLERKQTFPPIKNESLNGLKNIRGRLVMARRKDPDSATSQFFINLADNANLDPHNKLPGYTVFGEVIKGMEVVDKIGNLECGARKKLKDAPLTLPVIKSIRIIESSGKENQ